MAAAPLLELALPPRPAGPTARRCRGSRTGPAIGDREPDQDALIATHALERFGHGIGLDALVLEYSKLRVVLMRELRDVGNSLMRLHEAIDHARHRPLHPEPRRGPRALHRHPGP